MSEHFVTVGDFFEQSNPEAHPPLDYSSACVSVKPPIRVGEKFNDAVLGAQGRRGSVSLSELVTTTEETVFIARSGRGEPEVRHADIALIAQRVGQLVDAPGTALQMMAEKPFPVPRAEYGL